MELTHLLPSIMSSRTFLGSIRGIREADGVPKDFGLFDNSLFSATGSEGFGMTVSSAVPKSNHLLLAWKLK